MANYDYKAGKQRVENILLDDNDYIFDQIKINAGICKKKHKFFTNGIYALIPMLICSFFLLLMLSGVLSFK